MHSESLDSSSPEGGKLPASPQPNALTAPAARSNSGSPLELIKKEHPSDRDEFDLRHYWLVMLKRKWTVLSTFGIVLLTVLLICLLMTPLYRANTTIEIDRESAQAIEVQGMNDQTSQFMSDDDEYLKTQYSLLQSIALSRRVASQLRLANDPVYLHLKDASPISKLFSLMVPAQRPAPLTLSSDAESAEIGGFVNKNIVIEPVKDTRLVIIHFDSANPLLSQKIANSIADNFIASNIEHSFNASAYARTYLEGRLAQLKQRLAESEAHLIEIATKQKLFLDSTGKPTLTTTDLEAMIQALVMAENNTARTEARWNLAKSLSNDSFPAEMMTNSIAEPLKQQRATLQADYQEKLSIYKPNYPLMQAEKHQLDELDQQIAAEYAGIKKSIHSDYTAALTQQNTLQKQLDELKDQALDQQHRSIEYDVAFRDVNSNQQLYDGLLARYKEIGIAGGITSNNMSIVDRADVPAKVHFPNLFVFLPVGAIFGMFLGVGLALLFERLDDTIKTPEDVEAMLGLAVLGLIPRIKGSTPKEALADQRSAFSEAYRSVRTALQFSTASGVPRSLLVTSATPNEGKSTTATTLAINIAQLGKSVLLIDADLRNPSLHKILELENGTGLSNVLSGATQPQDAIQRSAHPNVYVMSSGPLPPDPAELLAGPKMISLLTLAIAKYDQVIIDAPPTVGIADSLIIAHIAQGTLLVVDSGATRCEVGRGAIKRLFASHARVVGAVLTKFDPKLSTYGYGYGYGSYSYYTYGSDKPQLTKQ